MRTVQPSERRSSAGRVVALVTSLLLAACEPGSMLDQSVLVGVWSGPIDDSTRYAMALYPEGDRATTVISRIVRDGAVAPAGDTTHYAHWWYGHDRSDTAAASTVPELCLVRQEDDDFGRCHAVHAVQSDTLDVTEPSGRRLRLIRVGGTADTTAAPGEGRP